MGDIASKKKRVVYCGVPLRMTGAFDWMGSPLRVRVDATAGPMPVVCLMDEEASFEVRCEMLAVKENVKLKVR